MVVRCVTSLVVARGALVRSRSIVYNKALGTKRCYSSMNTGITRFTNITVCHGSVVYSRVMPMKRETIVLSGVLSRNTPTLTRQRPPLALLLCHRPPSRCPCAHVSGLVCVCAVRCFHLPDRTDVLQARSKTPQPGQNDPQISAARGRLRAVYKKPSNNCLRAFSRVVVNETAAATRVPLSHIGYLLSATFGCCLPQAKHDAINGAMERPAWVYVGYSP